MAVSAHGPDGRSTGQRTPIQSVSVCRRVATKRKRRATRLHLVDCPVTMEDFDEADSPFTLCYLYAHLIASPSNRCFNCEETPAEFEKSAFCEQAYCRNTERRCCGWICESRGRCAACDNEAIQRDSDRCRALLKQAEPEVYDSWFGERPFRYEAWNRRYFPNGEARPVPVNPVPTGAPPPVPSEHPPPPPSDDGVASSLSGLPEQRKASDTDHCTEAVCRPES